MLEDKPWKNEAQRTPVSMDFFKRLQAVTRQVLDWKQMASASILGCHWTSVQKRVIKLWYSWQKWSKIQANTLFFFPIQEKEGHVQEVWKVFSDISKQVSPEFDQVFFFFSRHF